MPFAFFDRLFHAFAPSLFHGLNAFGAFGVILGGMAGTAATGLGGLLHALVPFLAGLLIFLVTLSCFSTSVVITVTMMPPFVAVVVAPPVMAVSITVMISAAVLVAIVIQHILLAEEGGFAAFFAGAGFAFAFRSFAGAFAGAAVLELLAHFIQFLGLFLGEDGAHFLLVFLTESAEFFPGAFPVAALSDFGH